MLKKTLAAAAVAGALILGGASAAIADTYPPEEGLISISAPTVTAGGSVVITATGLGDYDQVTFTHNAPDGSTIASIAFASAAGGSVLKPVSADGVASATFTPSTPGTYTIQVLDGATLLRSIDVTVVAAAAGGDAAAPGLPPTGGSVPAAAIWAGVGAVGLGGIAVAAVAARRRTQKV